MSEVRTARRYLRFKALEADARGDVGMASAWKGKLLLALGTPLPADFPHLELLALADPPYAMIEDLDGADADELIDLGVLLPSQADDVIAAVDAYVPPAPAGLDFSTTPGSQYLALI